MYKDVKSKARLVDGYSKEFGMEGGVHQGFVLSSLYFIVMLDALSRKFGTCCPWEQLNADDLMIISFETLGNCSLRLRHGSQR